MRRCQPHGAVRCPATRPYRLCPAPSKASPASTEGLRRAAPTRQCAQTRIEVTARKVPTHLSHHAAAREDAERDSSQTWYCRRICEREVRRHSEPGVDWLLLRLVQVRSFKCGQNVSPGRGSGPTGSKQLVPDEGREFLLACTRRECGPTGIRLTLEQLKKADSRASRSGLCGRRPWRSSTGLDTGARYS